MVDIMWQQLNGNAVYEVGVKTGGMKVGGGI